MSEKQVVVYYTDGVTDEFECQSAAFFGLFIEFDMGGDKRKMINIDHIMWWDITDPDLAELPEGSDVLPFTHKTH